MNPAIDISHVVLYTQRLMLRPWRPDDLEDLYAFASQDGVGQMCGWNPHKSIEESEKMLRGLIEGKIALALIYQDKAIGTLGIPKYDEAHFPQFIDLRCRELSFMLNRDYWGHGLMPEAVNEVIRFLFEDIGLDVIFCGHFVFNTRSAHLQEKLGFHLCGYTKYHTRIGTIEDNQVNYMTKEEWLQRTT